MNNYCHLQSEGIQQEIKNVDFTNVIKPSNASIDQTRTEVALGSDNKQRNLSKTGTVPKVNKSKNSDNKTNTMSPIDVLTPSSVYVNNETSVWQNYNNNNNNNAASKNNFDGDFKIVTYKKRQNKVIIGTGTSENSKLIVTPKIKWLFV